MNPETKELQLLLADIIDHLAATDKEIGDLAAALVALRLTLAEMGADFEKHYAKHFAGQAVQQVIQKSVASRDVLLQIARTLRGQA